MVSELRPRGIGEILDAAVVLYRARFTRLIRVAAFVVVPVQVLSALVLLSAQPDRYSLSVTGTVNPQYDSSSAAVGFAATMVVLVIGVLSTAFIIAACSRFVADAYIGEDSSTAGSAFRSVRPRVFAIIGTSAIVLISEALGFVACFIGVLVPLTFFAVAYPALILERIGASDAISRSVRLTKAHVSHVLGLVLTTQLLVTTLHFAFAAAVSLILRSGGGTVAVVVAQSTANAISDILTIPLVATAIVVLYFDLRIRDEGFDVQLLMQRNDARIAV